MISSSPGGILTLDLESYTESGAMVQSNYNLKNFLDKQAKSDYLLA